MSSVICEYVPVIVCMHESLCVCLFVVKYCTKHSVLKLKHLKLKAKTLVYKTMLKWHMHYIRSNLVTFRANNFPKYAIKIS